jgi:hypothetical protein
MIEKRMLSMSKPTVFVKNDSGSDVSVFVSKYNGGGSDDWYTLKPNGQDSWTRDSVGWELVAFSTPDNSRRAGVYVKIPATVVFKSFDNIVA